MAPEIGERFSRWTVVGPSYTLRDRGGHSRRWVPCRCDCGIRQDVRAAQLKSGHSKSCGCWKQDHVDGELLSFNGFGDAHQLSRHPLYATWCKIRSRCYNAKAHNYRYYGGRGISVCPEWQEDARAFITWVEANIGLRPQGMTLDRVDNDENYKPGNLRWATQAEQNANKQCSNDCSLHHADGCPGT